MTSKHTHYAWTHSSARGSQKLVLLAMADGANSAGEISISLRDLVHLTGLSRTRIAQLIEELAAKRELRVVSSGGQGRLPNDYKLLQGKADLDAKQKPAPQKEISVQPNRIKPIPVEPVSIPLTADAYPTPAPEPKTAPPTQLGVDDVIKAGRIPPCDDQTFYWSRREHTADLDALTAATGLSVADICDRLRKAPQVPHVRRLTELRAVVVGG